MKYNNYIFYKMIKKYFLILITIIIVTSSFILNSSVVSAQKIGECDNGRNPSTTPCGISCVGFCNTQPESERVACRNVANTTSDWAKYYVIRETITTIGLSGQRIIIITFRFQYFGYICSIGDKCMGNTCGNSPLLRAGRCDCSVGGAYKICCVRAGGTYTPIAAVRATGEDDGHPPQEGMCPGNAITHMGTECPIVDLCPNLPEVQLSVPDGMAIDAKGNCVTDLCPNLDGIQSSVPPFRVIAENGNCAKDFCLNIDGIQWTMPGNRSRNETTGNCYITDHCLNLPGIQSSVPPGMIRDTSGNCITAGTDLCPNIAGVQLSVPVGMAIDANGNCVTDLCPNIDGAQPSLPAGMARDANGNCVTDLCPNIAGVQASVPAGMARDANGNCVTDLCPNLDGAQPSVPAGMVRDANGNCVTDLCPNIAGVQASVPAGMAIDENGNCVTDLCPNIAGIQRSMPDGLIIDTNGNCSPPCVASPAAVSANIWSGRECLPYQTEGNIPNHTSITPEERRTNISWSGGANNVCPNIIGGGEPDNDSVSCKITGDNWTATTTSGTRQVEPTSTQSYEIGCNRGSFRCIWNRAFGGTNSTSANSIACSESCEALELAHKYTLEDCNCSQGTCVRRSTVDCLRYRQCWRPVTCCLIRDTSGNCTSWDPIPNRCSEQYTCYPRVCEEYRCYVFAYNQFVQSKQICPSSASDSQQIRVIQKPATNADSLRTDPIRSRILLHQFINLVWNIRRPESGVSTRMMCTPGIGRGDEEGWVGALDSLYPYGPQARRNNLSPNRTTVYQLFCRNRDVINPNRCFNDSDLMQREVKVFDPDLREVPAFYDGFMRLVGRIGNALR